MVDVLIKKTLCIEDLSVFVLLKNLKVRDFVVLEKGKILVPASLAYLTWSKLNCVIYIRFKSFDGFLTDSLFMT